VLLFHGRSKPLPPHSMQQRYSSSSQQLHHNSKQPQQHNKQRGTRN
jgi:hypothetical protein